MKKTLSCLLAGVLLLVLCVGIAACGKVTEREAAELADLGEMADGRTSPMENISRFKMRLDDEDDVMISIRTDVACIDVLYEGNAMVFFSQKCEFMADELPKAEDGDGRMIGYAWYNPSGEKSVGFLELKVFKKEKVTGYVVLRLGREEDGYWVQAVRSAYFSRPVSDEEATRRIEQVKNENL